MAKPGFKTLSSERLTLLYSVSQTFNSSLDLDEVLNIVIDEVIKATNAERGFVVLRDVEDELDFRAARGMDQTTLNDPQFQISRGVVGEVTKEGEPILTSDAQLDERFSGRQSVVNLGLRSIMCAPLKVKQNLLGAIYVDNSLQAGIFTEDDLDLLAAIASSAANAIENARLYQVAVEKGRMERELQIAYKVQSSLIPQEIPQVPGWEFSAYWVPAREVAGDFYDFIHDDQGNLGLIIADVVDKGMPAALFMAFSRSTLRNNVLRVPAPKDGIAEVNKLICADSVYGMFLTLVFCLIEPDSGEVTYVNAGHNPPLLYHSDKNELTELSRTGIPLGIDEEASYDQETKTLNSGDFILFYTDGICDAVNSQGEEFGMERVRRVLLDHCQESAEEILVALERSSSDFTGSTAPFDDITVLIAKCM
ncbi:MAG TPA: SpoIIE family protein phosphatase [Anaerolineae bacterium]|nr:SpoIIE family protein phosphatase [Anaerolineae bacterium]